MASGSDSMSLSWRIKERAGFTTVEFSGEIDELLSLRVLTMTDAVKRRLAADLLRRQTHHVGHHEAHRVEQVLHRYGVAVEAFSRRRAEGEADPGPPWRHAQNDVKDSGLSIPGRGP